MTRRKPIARARIRGLAMAAGLLAGCAPPAGEPPPQPSILLITLDTTRADHLGCYGQPRATSPRIDELARESTVYTRALSTSSWTLPAHASLFTGKFPASHGARFDPDGPLILGEVIAAPEELRARGLARGEATLAELLRDAGYDTGAVVGGPWLLRTFGLDAGFDFYDDDGITSHEGRRADAVADRAIAWLARKRERPFFLFVNFFDPHFPYDPPARLADRFLLPGSTPRPNSRAQFEALYDAEILFMDAELGRLLDFLRERGLFESTLVVVTSDHGELFGEHGEWGHQRFLYEPLVRIPLIVKPPGPRRPGRRDDARVQILDVFRLVLDAAGVATPAGVQALPPGRDRAPVLAEVRRNDASLDGGWRALWDGSLKVLVNERGRPRLFDLARDPGESNDLARRDRATTDAAVAHLERAFAALPPPPPAEAPERAVDAETREALERLGYTD